jgi:hypothetical protein
MVVPTFPRCFGLIRTSELLGELLLPCKVLRLLSRCEFDEAPFNPQDFEQDSESHIYRSQVLQLLRTDAEGPRAGNEFLLLFVFHDRPRRDVKVFSGGLYHKVFQGLSLSVVIEEVGYSFKIAVDGAAKCYRHHVVDATDGAKEVVSVVLQEFAFDVVTMVYLRVDVTPLFPHEFTVFEEVLRELILPFSPCGQFLDASLGDFLVPVETD